MTKYNRKLTANDHASLLGDELTRLTAAYIKNPNARTLADRDVALISRCASMAAQAALPIYVRMEGLEERIEGMNVELAELWLKLDVLESRIPKPETTDRE